MLDIYDFREGKGGDLERLRELQRRRYADPAAIDKIVALDESWRKAVNEVETMKMKFNSHNKEIGKLKKAKQDASELQTQSKKMKEDIEREQASLTQNLADRDAELSKIGNYVHDSVPVSNDEENNVQVKTWGTPREEADLKNHVDLVLMLDIADLDSGTAVAGGRGYFLKNEGVFLNQALIQCALHHGYSKGMMPIMTPFMMRQSVMAACAQLSQFDEELYKCTGEGEDKYMIATAEQPLCALHKDKWFEQKDLPMKYVGYSTCFRKEAGSHGRDTTGIFRVHQFEKVEQFVVTSPHDNASWEALDEMLSNAEEFYQKLGLPYQVVNIVSGELNSAAAKKYDVEAWFPASRTYRELVSCSNCTDYQARRLGARLRAVQQPGQDSKDVRNQFVHMLNCTLSATERTLCCVLENYQTKDGIRVPEVLRPFMPNNMDFIPFRKDLEIKKQR